MGKRHKWHEQQPIYRQLSQELIGGILDRNYPEGQMLPSVRQLADMYDVNPLTAAKACRELASEGLIEALRGEGLVVRPGARAAVLRTERSKFLKEEWPRLHRKVQRLELDLDDLFALD